MKFTKLACLAAAIVCGTTLSAAELNLVKAVYGAGDKTVDVTEAVQQKLSGLPGTFLLFRVDNQTMGADPARGSAKSVTVTYSEDGVEKTAQFGENQTAVILAGAVAQEEFKVLAAYYGVKDKWNDVTGKVAKACADKTELTVDNNDFGPDPLRGAAKTLIVVFTSKNAIKTLQVQERIKFSGAETVNR